MIRPFHLLTFDTSRHKKVVNVQKKKLASNLKNSIVISNGDPRNSKLRSRVRAKAK